ncbi:MAG: hypothetical protein CM1200mP2_20990 [Planctomycetaceae bacterium]|nr:MAG: hypothetical protein CM1200mP2_20990 [Planctomycetaceae bacterium]
MSKCHTWPSRSPSATGSSVGSPDDSTTRRTRCPEPRCATISPTDSMVFRRQFGPAPLNWRSLGSSARVYREVGTTARFDHQPRSCPLVPRSGLGLSAKGSSELPGTHQDIEVFVVVEQPGHGLPSAITNGKFQVAGFTEGTEEVRNAHEPGCTGQLVPGGDSQRATGHAGRGMSVPSGPYKFGRSRKSPGEIQSLVATSIELFSTQISSGVAVETSTRMARARSSIFHGC